MTLLKKADPVEYDRVDADAWINLLNQAHRNVRESSYGALGNNTGDDGPAIQAAINDAVANGGGIVYMPPGTYRIATPFTVGNGVTLMGAGWDPHVFGAIGTWLHVVNNAATLAAPLIRVTGWGERLKHFAVWYDQPTPGPGWGPTAYPYAIQCAGTPGNLANDIEIIDIHLANATYGIQLGNAGASISVGRILVSRISGHVFNIGISGEYILDICRVEHIHWWPFSSTDPNVVSYTRTHAIGLIGARWDNPIIEDFFSIQHRIGLYMSYNSFGVTQRLQATNIGIDSMGYCAVYVDGDNASAHISNLYCTAELLPTSGLIIVSNNAHIQLSNFYPAGM